MSKPHNNFRHVKMDLANKYKDDRDEYTRSKTEFILDVIQLAKQGVQKQ